MKQIIYGKHTLKRSQPTNNERIAPIQEQITAKTKWRCLKCLDTSSQRLLSFSILARLCFRTDSGEVCHYISWSSGTNTQFPIHLRKSPRPLQKGCGLASNQIVKLSPWDMFAGASNELEHVIPPEISCSAKTTHTINVSLLAERLKGDVLGIHLGWFKNNSQVWAS